jgi:two-component system chemotaxis sensor kinase CheA
MQRIVRDTSKKVGKKVNLVLIGEETEVDKNIIDSLTDPLMHLIRNAIDHGIETSEERLKKGKPEHGRITLEAKNTGEDVMIIVSDDGKGLDADALIQKAKDKGLITKSRNEISEKEAYSYIYLPGFSTKETVTEFSGRGVGMDVVREGIEKLGGNISIDSTKDEGTTISIRIPLTLAIVDGMRLTVGPLSLIAPMISIRESFVPDIGNVFLDPEGNEMIMIRGECYSIVRLHKFFGIEDAKTEIAEGILIMIDSDVHTFCILSIRSSGNSRSSSSRCPNISRKRP